jgi:hypothetical protein
VTLTMMLVQDVEQSRRADLADATRMRQAGRPAVLGRWVGVSMIRRAVAAAAGLGLVIGAASLDAQIFSADPLPV